jgi:hypothetical protein
MGTKGRPTVEETDVTGIHVIRPGEGEQALAGPIGARIIEDGSLYDIHDIHDLAHRPGRGGPNSVASDSGVGLANATMQLRLVAVRLVYDHLVEEGLRESNPVGRVVTHQVAVLPGIESAG